MELFGQLGIALLSLIISIIASTAAHVLPRSPAQQAPQASASMPSSELGIEYSSLQSAALGKELKYAVMLPPSYKTDAKRRYPVLYFLHGMFGSEREFERRGVAAKIASMREQGAIGEFIIVAVDGGR